MVSLSSMANSLTLEEKTKIVENVYKRVYSAMGLAEDRPRLIFDNKQEINIAYMKKDRDGNPTIGFEEKAFDVCEQFGSKRDEAIAYLLGHEISHHHFGHHWGNEFSTAYSVNNLITELKEVDKEGIKRFETQADERGGIYCYLAGYNVQGLCEDLLRKLYEAYGIKNSPKYPSLEERIQIAKDRDSIVSTYIKVFETANYAMLMGEYQIAINGYEYVIGKGFHSREIYNNFGVAYFLRGLVLAGQDIKYMYPVEIDLESKINRGGNKGAGEADSSFILALDKFQRAILFDKTYSTAYLNAACAHSVLKEYDDATYLADKAIKFAKLEGRTNVEDNALLVKAIVEHQKADGDKDLMNKIMSGLIKKKNSFAEVNQLIFDGKTLKGVSFSGKPISWTDESNPAVTTSQPSKEIMDNVRSYQVEFDILYSEEIKYGRSESVFVGTRDESVIYQIENGENNVFVFHAAKSNYKGLSGKGMKIGSTKNQILDAYGYPAIIMNARQGTIMLYPNGNNTYLIFVLDQTDCISSWVVVKVM